MAQLSNLIQDEQLIGLQFDTNHIATVLNEILKLFQDQTQRLTKIEHQLPYLAEKSSIEKLENEFDEFSSQTKQKFEQIETDNKQRDENIASELAKLKEYIDEESLASVSETRRLVTNEISNYVPSVYENDPIIMKINENIDKTKKAINEMRETFDLISTPSGKEGSGPSSIRLLQCEKKVKELEIRLQSYPQIESDLSNLQLQFPTVVRRLERKINDIQSAIEDKAGITITTSSVEPALTPAPPATITEATQDENSEINILPPLPKASELPQLLPDLELPPSMKNTKETEQTFTKDEQFEISADKNEPVVRVYETHTHVSELNSSVRVVSELEWCTKAINQHHETLRQVQQNLRTQQDNFDTITENLMRVNTKHNSRLSQLAQQQLSQNQEIDELKRYVSEHMSALQQKVTKSMRELQTEMSSNLASATLVKKVEDSPRSGEKYGGSKKITLPVLSPLKLTPANSTRKEPSNEFAELSSDAESTERDTKRSQLWSSKPNTYETKSDDSASYLEEPSREPKKNRINLTFAQFNTDIPGTQVTKTKPVYLTAQETFNNSRYDYPSSTTGSPQRPHHISPQKSKSQFDIDDEEFPERPTQEITAVRNPIVVNGDAINFTRAAMRQGLTTPNGYPEFSLNGQEINEMIEDKVSMVARKSVSILVDKARTEMKEQTKQVQKTVDQVISLIDIKIDREFVERMFNKFRVMVNEINEKIDNLQCSFLEWVTRDELEMVLQKFAGVVADVKDAAATKTKYNCLLCGRPRQHLAGMLTTDSHYKPARSSSKTSVKGSRKLSTAMPPTVPANSTISNDQSSETSKRSKTALGGQPHDVVQFLTLT